jgi:hypothetical protein
MKLSIVSFFFVDCAVLSTTDDTTLRYKFLNEFDKAMNLTEEKYHWLNRYAYVMI